jgi:hypothetical protein
MVRRAQRKWRSSVCVTAAVVLFTVFLARAASEEKQEGAFGEAANGLQLALEVKPTTWPPGAKIEFLCAVKNVSDKSIRVPAWGLDLGQALEVTDAAGKVVKYGGGRDRTRRPTADDFPVIEPGQTKPFVLRGQLTEQKMLTVGEPMGGVWTWQLADGKYLVHAVFDRPAGDDRFRPQAGGETWTGKALSPVVKVTVGGEKAAAEAAPATGGVEPARSVGGEAANGLKLTLAADSAELRMKPRILREASQDTPHWDVEPVKLTFTFTNVSDKPIKLDTYALVWGRLKLEVQGPDAESVRTVQQLVDRKREPPRAEDYPTIEPGKRWTYKYQQRFPGFFGETEHILLKPGEYRVRATHTCGEAAAYARFSIGCWAGLVTSNEIVLKAVAVRAE